MEIKATGRLDLKTMQALTHLWLYKKANPKKRMIFWSIVYAILSVVILLEMILFGIDSTLLVLLICVVIIYLLGCYMYFLLPKMRYNSLAKMKDIVNEYTFCDEMININTKSIEYSAECELKYSRGVEIKIKYVIFNL